MSLPADLRDAGLTGRWRFLDERCVFRVTGPDRVRYLNGQVTNDVTRLVEGESLPACLCSIKGKVEALVWIHAEGEALVLDGERTRRDFLGTRLNRYLIADDCEIEDLSDEVKILHHFDPARGGVRSRRLGQTGWDLFLNADAPVPFPMDALITEQEWDLEEIRARIPRYGCEITGEEFPSEIGLDAWAVDYHKGCYLGQEIVSRLRSVGRAKHELAAVVAAESFARGDRVMDLDGNEGRATRDSRDAGEKTFRGLALFKRDRSRVECLENERVVTKSNHSSTPF